MSYGKIYNDVGEWLFTIEDNRILGYKYNYNSVLYTIVDGKIYEGVYVDGYSSRLLGTIRNGRVYRINNLSLRDIFLGAMVALALEMAGTMVYCAVGKAKRHHKGHRHRCGCGCRCHDIIVVEELHDDEEDPAGETE